MFGTLNKDVVSNLSNMSPFICVIFKKCNVDFSNYFHWNLYSIYDGRFNEEYYIHLKVRLLFEWAVHLDKLGKAEITRIASSLFH